MIDYDYIYRSFISGHLHPFYRDMYGGLIRYAVRLLGDRLAYMAEDCVQDCILRAYIHRDEMPTMDRWRSWMLVTIRNRAVEMLRRAATAGGLESGMKISGEMTSEEEELAVIEQETLDAIYAIVSSLPEKYRQVFELCFERGMKISGIAGELGIAEITVKKRKARLIEIIHEKLGDGAVALLMAMAECCIARSL